MKKHPFFKENVDDADVWKTPVRRFFGHGCIASHVASGPPPPPGQTPLIAMKPQYILPIGVRAMGQGERDCSPPPPPEFFK